MLGKWICLEGPDRIGKTSLCRRLKEIIEQETGKPVYMISLPVREGHIWDAIKEYLTEGKNIPKSALDLLFIADFWKQSVAIREHLAGGGWVITDRWCSSTAVYSAARCVHDLERVQNQEWIETVIQNLPLPDITIWLDCQVELLKTRPGWGDEREETEEQQRKVIGGYRKWFATNHTIPKNTVYRFEVHPDTTTNILAYHIWYDYINTIN